MPKNKAYFDYLFQQYHKRQLVSPDPLQFLYEYPNIQDREIVALLCACFAYGNVKQILKNLSTILAKIKNPHAFTLVCTAATLRKTFNGFKYRFTTEEQLCNLLLSIRRILKQYGSLEACFLAGYRPEQATVCEALRAFATQLRANGEVGTLVPDPAKNSALKRLNLFLRWLVRCDEVDPGGWTVVKTAQLIVPLDVHMHRVARRLKLTNRNAPDMKTALEISCGFAQFNPQDPVCYDFCLTRFGIRDDMDEDDLQ